MAKKGKGCSDGCLKKIGIVFAVFIVLGIIGCAAGGGSGQSTSSSSTLTAAEPSNSISANTSGSASSSTAQAVKTKATTAKKKSSDKKKKLRVRIVDVGQGDGNVIEFPDGKTMVIDTGSQGSDAVIGTLERDKRTHVNWLVATHPDADHIGGLDEVMYATDVSQVWAPRATNTTQAYTNFLQAAKDEGCKIKAAASGKVIAKGKGYSAKLVWPPKGAQYRDTNDMSAVIVVKYGKTKYLFTGDAPIEALEQADAGKIDVLKVSHHGSASGTDATLAASLSPKVAVLSYGADNDYGHPAQTVLDALHGVGAKVYGTGVNGTVTVSSNGSKISVKTQRKGKVKANSANAGAGNSRLDSGTSGGAASAGGASGSHKKYDSGNGHKAAAQRTEPTVTGSNDKANERTVYVTPYGKKYHACGCRTLSRSKNLTEMSESEAEAAGYTACAVCGG